MPYRQPSPKRGMAVVVDGGQVIVTSPAEYRETLRRVRYTVADLTGEDKAAVAQLAALVRRLVAPESWQSAGGRGTIEPGQGVLVVLQTGDVHQQVLVFCERLRNARQKPLLAATGTRSGSRSSHGWIRPARRLIGR